MYAHETLLPNSTAVCLVHGSHGLIPDVSLSMQGWLQAERCEAAAMLLHVTDREIVSRAYACAQTEPTLAVAQKQGSLLHLESGANESTPETVSYEHRLALVIPVSNAFHPSYVHQILTTVQQTGKADKPCGPGRRGQTWRFSTLSTTRSLLRSAPTNAASYDCW